MIGGTEREISGAGENTADVVIRAMQEMWPHALFQAADWVQAVRLQPMMSGPDPYIDGAMAKEFFIFKNAEAERLWRERGADADNENQMLRFLVGDKLTIVYDRDTEEMLALVGQLAECLRSVAGLTRSRP
jgi:hypothetical protein